MADPSSPVLIAVHGAAGRMGREVIRASLAHPRVRVAAALVRPGSPLDGGAVGSALGHPAFDLDFTSALDPDVALDAFVDFTGAHAFDAGLALARERRVAFVSGSTGLSAPQQQALADAATQIPVLWSANFSLGVAILARVARIAAQAVPDWDCEIIEMHHGRKVDAPSGTALALGEGIAQARGLDLDDCAVHGRRGRPGERRAGEIGLHALRGGDVVGEHEVFFVGPGERLELSHRATDRSIFARGAVVAAAWIAGRAPGRYALDDLVGDAR
jgi:4-hydroxy-tetrahydrodipicolinate reductase